MIHPDTTDLSSATVAQAFDAMHSAKVTGEYNGHWFEARGEKLSTLHTGPCHGGLSGAGTTFVATLSPWLRTRYTAYVYYSKAPYKKPIGIERATRWYDWLANHSWAAPYVIAPDLETVRDVGFVIDSRTPANYVNALLAMSRHAGEQRHNVERMFDYADEFDLPLDLAFFLAFGTQTDNKYGDGIWGHNLFYQAGAAQLDNFVRRDIKRTNASLTSGATTQGVYDMWGSRTSDIAKSFERFKTKVEAGKVVIPNPFAPVAKVSSGLTEDFVRSIIPNLKDYYAHDQLARQAA